MIKKFATWCLIAVVVMWVINDPHGAAALVHNGAHTLSRAASSLGSIASSFS